MLGAPAKKQRSALTAPAGGMAVTIRRDRRSPNVWSVQGPGARRIGSVQPVQDPTACWQALRRDGGIQGRGASFGAAVGLLVDAAIERQREEAKR